MVQVDGAFARADLYPPHKPQRRDEFQNRKRVPLALGSTVRHDPDSSRRTYQRNDQPGLFSGTAIAHRRNDVRPAVLVKPPDIGKAHDDHQVIHGTFDEASVVQEPAAVEAMDDTSSFPLAGEQIFWRAIGICDVPTRITDELAVLVQRNGKSPFEEAASGDPESEFMDGFGREALAPQKRMGLIESLEFEIKGRIYHDRQVGRVGPGFKGPFATRFSVQTDVEMAGELHGDRPKLFPVPGIHAFHHGRELQNGALGSAAGTLKEALLEVGRERRSVIAASMLG